MIRLLLFVCHSQPAYWAQLPLLTKCLKTHTLILLTSFFCSFSLFASNPLILLAGNVDAGEDVTVCRGTGTQLEATGTGNFVWSPNDGSLSCTSCPNPVATPNTTTEYIVTCDDGVFISTDTVLVTVLPLPIFNGPTTTNPTDCDSNDGEIIIDATEDGAAIEYSITNGLVWQASNTFSNLSAGIYNLKIRNASDDSCEVEGGEVTLVAPDVPTVDMVNTIEPTDCGTLTGIIGLTVSGGLGTYEYSNNGGTTWQSGNTFTNLPAGFYPMRVRNFNETCEISGGTILLSDPVLPAIREVIVTSPCNNNNAGSITISTENYSTNFEFTIDAGTSWFPDSTFTNLGAGTYNVAVRVQSPANSCADVYDLNPITFGGADAPPIITGASPVNSNSCANPNGQITIFADGGSGSYEFSIDNGITWVASAGSSHTFTGLSEGNYQTAVRNDDASCETFGAVLPITQPATPTIDDVMLTQPTDCGAMDGTITIDASGGEGPPYSYSLNGGNEQATPTFNNLAAGTYTVAVSNANGDCEFVGSTEILVEPGAPSISGIETTPPSSCTTSNGSITITATGGSNDYEYSIDDGLSFVASNVFNGLAGGDYIVKIRNAVDDSCETEGQVVNLATPLAPTIDDIITMNPNDCDNPDGSIVIQSDNDPGDFMYSIDGGTSYQASNTFNGLGGGNYTIAVMSAAACETINPSTTTLSAPEEPTLSAGTVTQDPSGCGTNDGSLTIFAQGGTLEYSINGGTDWQGSSFFGGLNPGAYDIRIRKVGGFCEITAPMETLAGPNPPMISNVTFTDPTDCNRTDGTITISASGDATIEYSVTGGLSWQATNMFGSLPGGSYDVRVRYINQTTCETMWNEAVELTAPTAPSIVGTTNSPVTDCDAQNGTITIEASGGSGSYEYSIDGGTIWQASPNFPNLAAGTYDIMVRNDTPNCEVGGTSVTIDGPTPPVINGVQLTDPTGCGLSDGDITISASGEDALEYSIDGGTTWQLSNDFPGLPENMYFIRVRYTNMTCMVMDIDRSLIAPARPDITNIIADNPDCTGNNGRIEVIVDASGAAPLEYSIDGGTTWQFGSVFENLIEDSYPVQVRVSGDGGCEASGGMPILLEHEPPTIATVNSLPPSDCNVADGFIQIIVSGNNTGGFEFSIDGGMTWQPSNGFSDLGAGNYTPVVRPTNTDCPVFGEAIILTDPDAPVIDNIAVIHPDCDMNDGQITITASGGSGMYQYSIDGGDSWQNSNLFNGLGEGNYEIGVRNDDASCPVMATDMTTLIEPNRPTVSMVNSDNPTCEMSNGMIEVIASGGTGSLEYSINGGVDWQSSNTFNDLGIGTYEVLVRNDEPSCATPAATITLTEPAAPQMSEVNEVHPTDCGASNGQIQIVASGIGTLEYSIDNGETWQLSSTFNNLPQGTYVIRVRLQDGSCEALGDTVVLEDPETPVIDIVTATDPTDCGLTNGRVTITTIGDEANYEFSIDGGTTWQSSNIFNGLGEGTYSIAVRNDDAAGSCVVFGETVMIEANEMPVITSVDFNHPDCDMDNGSITINATSSGDLEYSIDNGQNWSINPVFTDLGEDIYQILVRNINGTCETSTDNVSLTEPAAPNVINFDATNPDCNGENGSIIIAANGGQAPLEYSIDNGVTYQISNEFLNLPPDTYDIFVRNADDSCPVFGGTTELIMPTAPEAIQITPTSSTECADTNPNGTITISTNDINVEYSIDGGTTWQVDLVFTGLASGTYNVLARRFGETCSVSLGVVTVEGPDTPAFSSINQSNPTDCDASNGSIEIIPEAGMTLMYSIDGGMNFQASNTFDNLDADEYSIFISNADGSCARAIGTVVLTNPEQPQIDAANVANSICIPNSGTIQLVASGGSGNLEYSIDGGMTWQSSNIFMNLGPDTYTPSVRNEDETCEVIGDAVTIIEISGPEITMVSSTNPSDCGLMDGSITITATADGDIEYSINGGESWETSGVYDDLNGGTYEILVRNAEDGSCEIEDENVTLNGGEEPTIEDIVLISPSECGVDDGIIQIIANGVGDLEYSIDNGVTWQDTNTFSDLSADTYTILVRNIDGSCAVEGGDQSLIAPPEPDITSINVTDITDCEVENGTIEIIVAGNTDLQYSIDGGENYQAQNTFENLPPGTYTIIVRNPDGSCATQGSEVTIEGLPQPIITEILEEDPTACNVNDGRILIFINLDREDFEFSIDGGLTFQESHIFDGLQAGEYDIRIRYLNNTCEVEAVAQATLEGETIMITAVNTSDPSTCGASDGFLDISLSADGMYEYSIDNGVTWQSMNFFSGLGAGMYSVLVRNVDGSCQTESETVTLVDPNLPTIENVNTTNPSSCATTDGRIEIIATGDETLQYSIDGGINYQLGNEFANLTEGTYTIQVSYLDGGCVVTSGVVISLATDDQPEVTDVNSTPLSGCGTNDGIINIIATGTQGLIYSIDGGTTYQEDNNFTGLPGGVYNIVVAYVGETCPQDGGEITLVEPDAPSIDNINATPPSACGLSDGMIEVTAAGVNDLEYSINGTDWQSSNIFDNLAEGSYTVRVRYVGGTCEVEADAATILTAPDDLTISNVSTTNAGECGNPGGTITISLESGADNIEYSIDNGLTYQPSNTFTGLIIGEYTIMVRVAGTDCEALYTDNPVTITGGNGVVISNVVSATPTDCDMANGMISITADCQLPGSDCTLEYSIDGGMTYQASNIFNGLSSGEYDVRVRKTDGTCESVWGTVTVITPSPPTIESVTFEHPTDCGEPDGTITIVATGDSNLEYSINGGTDWQSENVFNGLDEGVYTILVRNEGGGCEVTHEEMIVLESCCLIRFVLEQLEDGTYQVSMIPDTTLTEPDNSTMNLQVTIVVPAEGFELSNMMSASPAFAFNVNVINTPAQNPNFDYINFTLAVSTMAIPYNQGVAVPLFTFESTSLCADNGANISIMHNLTDPFQSNEVGNLVSILEIEDEDITICTFGTDTAPAYSILQDVMVVQPSDCGAADGSITIITDCPDDGCNYEFSIDGGVTFADNHVFNNLIAGSYNVVVRHIDENCEVNFGDNPIQLGTGDEPMITDVITTNPTTCTGTNGMLQVVATGSNLMYSIDGVTFQSSNLFQNLSAGTYTVFVQSDGDCTVAYSLNPVLINEGTDGQPIIADVMVTNPSTCESTDGSIVIVASGTGDLEYSIDGGTTWQISGTFNGLMDGAYDVAVRNATDGTCEVSLVENPVLLEAIDGAAQPEIIDITTDDPSCSNNDGTINVTAEGCGDIEYSIDGMNWQSANTFANLSSGVYTVTVRSVSDNTLTDSQSAVLNVPAICSDTIFVTIPNDSTVICIDPVLDVPNGPGEVSICDNGEQVTIFLVQEESCLSVVPDDDFMGTDTICIVTCDVLDPSICDTTVIIIDVEEPDDLMINPDTTFVTIPNDMTSTECITQFIDTPNGIGNVSICDNPDDINVNLDLQNGEVCVSLQPINGFLGTDTVCVVVCDLFVPELCDTTIIIVTVVDDGLTPLPDTLYETTLINTPIEVCLDEYILPAEDVVLSSCGAPTDGMMTFDGECMTYDPNFNFLGMDTMCVAICDVNDATNCDTVFVIITVEPDGTLTPLPDTLYETTLINTPIEVCLDEYILPAEDVVLSSCGAPTDGMMTFDGECMTYDPNFNFLGMDTMCVAICDVNDATNCDTVFVIITVEPDGTLTPLPDTLYETTLINTPIEVCLDEYILPAEDVVLSSCGAPTDGMMTFDGECMTYDPNFNFLGMDTMCVAICDVNDATNCDTVFVIITVEPGDLIPLPDTIYETTEIETPIEICLDELYILNAENIVLTSCDEPNNGDLTFDAACLTYTPEMGFLGLDTMCVAVCDVADPNNCDTTIVIINVTPITDTINIIITDTEPIDTCLTDVLDIMGELTTTICGVDDTNFVVTIDSICVSIDPVDDFTGTDTICVVTCNDNMPPDCDTTIIIITIDDIEDCIEEIFEATELTFEGNEAEICVPIPFSESAIYDVCIDGVPYTQTVEACDTETFVSYFYGLTPGQLASGPYNVETWIVNDTAYAGLINDAQGLENFMNFWDADGNWTIDPVTFTIFGGDGMSVYDTLVIRQDATNETITLAPVISEVAAGFTVIVSGEGSHSLVVKNTNTGCSDEITIILEGGDVPIDDTLRLVTDFETPTDPICVDTLSLPGNVISQTLCDLPSNGTVDSVGVNCFVYTPDDDFIGLDTFCVVLCDDSEPPVCDTTIVIIETLAPDCGIFEADTISLMTEDCDVPAELCLDVNLSEFITYDIFDNGETYDNGVTGCQFDTTFRYIYLTVPDLGAAGPYNVDSWAVNGMIFSGTFLNISALTDSMNVWDTTGDWVVDGTTFAILGGNPASTYGTMVITQITTNANTILMPSIEPIPTGSALSLMEGTHELVLVNNVTGCTDTALVIVTCPTDTMTVVFEDITIDTTTNVGQPETICLDEVLGIDIEDITSITNICEDQGTGNVNFVLDTMTSCIILESLTVGADTACFEVCIGVDTCAIVTINVTVLDMCEDFIPVDVVGTGIDCEGQDTILCIPIPLSEMINYSIEADGEPYEGMMIACNLDSMFTYSYSSLLGLGDGPFNVDEWQVNQDTFMGEFTSVVDLVDSLNIWDPSTTWTFDESTLTIRGANPNNTYGPIIVTEIASGGMAELVLNALLIPLGTGIELGLGTHQLVFTDMETGCRDTLMGTIACMDTETIFDTINVADMEQICLDTFELQGNFVSISNDCPEESGESVVFTIETDSLCITYEGFEPGTETACIILCDDLGICDTTYIIVTVLETDDGLDAIDDLATTTQGGTVVIDVLTNDIIPNNTLDTFYIVNPPALGTVEFDNDGLVTYIHDGDTCNVVDNFTYAICNSTACDTALVTIDIPCDTLMSGDFEIFNGFSPNGDDINENFIIIGLDEFPNHTLQIFNRWGNLVYKSEAYRNDWDGTWNGKDVPSGTYFYLLDLGNGEKPLSGYLVIRR